MAEFRATYSPEDNKLRLYASSRLDAGTYARVKAAGFRWAPKQDLFFAPAWSPEREDLLIELAGEIGDEDTSLVDRAEARADRFEDYSEKRAQDSERAHAAVAEIADNIPLGQPILVGHHSERHARRDQKRIDSGMRKAVTMWKRAEYWEQRAAGCLRHAKYKELPSVRARRIKTIEADKRKVERAIKEAHAKAALWESCKSLEQARVFADRLYQTVIRNGSDSWTSYDLLRERDTDALPGTPLVTWEQVRDILRAVHEYPRSQRWIEHFNNRLSYEKALLAEQGALALLDRKPKSAKAQSPLLNYRMAAGKITIENPYNRGTALTFRQIEMSKAEYSKIYQDYKGTRWSADKSHRFRTALVNRELVAVFLIDLKADEPKSTIQPYLIEQAAE